MNPQILHLYGPFWITSYGLFLALGLGVFLASVFFHRGRRHYISDDQFFDGAAAGIAGGLLGGKVLFLIQEASFSSYSWSELIHYLLGGFAILGAILGALAGVIAYLWWQELAIREVLDIVGAYALLAHGIARWGCFFAGCCYGALSKVSWLQVVYTNPQSLAPLHIPLYPAQVMMSVASLIGFFVIRFVVYPWKNRPLGTVVAWYVLYESASRFVIDYWRGDRQVVIEPISQIAGAIKSSWWPLSWYQYVAVMVMLGALGTIILLHMCGRKRW